MRLFICEKPSQARDIARVLQASRRGDGCLQGTGVTVTWCVGHLLETAPPEAYGDYKRWSLDDLPIIPARWQLVVKPKVASQLKVIHQLLRTCSEVVIATDADREGEMIAREILERCQYQGPVLRLWLSALDDASIRRGLGSLHPGEQTLPLYHCALARSRADWLVGINLSRLFTLLGRRAGFDGLLPVGRVQTPTLRLVVERDRAIASFVPQQFWTVDAQLEVDGTRFQARWQPPAEVCDDARRCIDEVDAQAAARRLIRQASAKVHSVEVERVREGPPLPFDLGTLQEVCSAKLGLGAQETLGIAQALYETHKATTYPRTDCGYLPESMLDEVPRVLHALAAAAPSLGQTLKDLDPCRRSRAWNSSKITAHHGIIPTAVSLDLAQLSERERAVYTLIRARYLAQFLPEHEYLKTQALLHSQADRLLARGKQILTRGWKAVINEGDGHEPVEQAQRVPTLHEAAALTLTDATVNAQRTQPPKAYTEGTLVKAMKTIANQVADPRLKQTLKDSCGLGTEATRAAIIQGLIDHGYLTKKKRSLAASAAAHTLIEAVPPEVADPVLTALWEQALDRIESGQLSVETFLAKQAEWLTRLVRSHASLTLRAPPSKGPFCPVCRSAMRQRKGRTGSFWSCTRYPECKGTKPVAKPKQGKKTVT
ncbi:DNA topoisomerase III [Pseudomonas sp. GD03817]|uniref:DNA topoisomerase n=1 Tax=Pseudomonas putida TaxID=303 RepID=A0A1L5PT23_PSEPU|nr:MULTISPECIES: DNA topoisomerase III [Pseudomonas]APO83317.1 DNA topoisomerase III [Pseudomonas putida]KIY42324.1 DNA topoisomerase III [Pseudomonas sp. 10-1B]MCE0989639.1 DNA topoisomerase III [Pseudomonas alloputida]MDH1400738.1 DNA topoisomerase III [Pseudomonas sp. GD03730]MDH1774498.1 DNA topoisomerase III [Pseudomonas sp. GD03817]